MRVAARAAGATETLIYDRLSVLAESVPTHLDLTSAAQRASVYDLTEALAEAYATPGELAAVDEIVSRDPSMPVSMGVAAKLALGRARLAEIEEPLHVSLVVAVYKEHERILTAAQHPAGEDFLREKLRQLRWVFAQAPRHDWDLTVVDDGCPEGSGRLAGAIFEEYAQPTEQVAVLHLEDAIRDGLPIVGSLTSTRESQKGGAVRLGLWHATQAEREGRHVVAFSDADLSTHLGQIGLLADSLIDPGVHAAIGSRREPGSVVVKAGTRDARGRLFIYLWKRMIPQLRGIVDTQCGFKAFDAGHLREWIDEVDDNGFSFDIEMLVRLQLESPGSIRKVAVAWIDSEVASTTAALEPYLPMLRSIARLYRARLPATEAGDRFAGLVDDLDGDAFRRLAANVPAPIASRDPAHFDDFDAVPPDELGEAAGL